MSYYYPQAAVSLRIRWEDFGTNDKELEKVYKLQLTPKRVSVNINDYMTADTFEVEIDYRSFPFDPRAMRAVGITIHMQDMGRATDSTGAPVQIVPTDSNTVFIGFADEESISFDDDKRTVKLEGRDQTGILIDAKFLKGTPVDLGLPVDQLIQQFLSSLPATKDLQVVNRIKGEDGKPAVLPTLAQYYPGFGQPLAGQRSSGADDTYWEVIQDIASRAGVLVYVELDKLVISSPRVLYDKGKARQFIYGHNLKTMEFKRKLGRHKGFNVLVRSLNQLTKEVLTANIPAEASDSWSKATGIPNKQVMVPQVGVNKTDNQHQPQVAPAMSFRVKNVFNKQQLIGIGEKIFEELSRQQLEGTFETREMVVRDKKNVLQDLTQLKIGTPVSVEIDSTDLYQISRFATKERRENYLLAQGYPGVFAKTFAKVLGTYTPVFYTKAVTLTLDNDTGFKLKVDFLNFIDLDHRALGLDGGGSSGPGDSPPPIPLPEQGKVDLAHG